MFRKFFKSSLLPVLAIGMATVFFACSSSDKYTVTSTGDSITSASLEKTSDGYKVTLAPIVDWDSGEVLKEADASSIDVSAGFDDEFTAKLGKVNACTATLVFGSGSASKADVAFLVDTTASMGSKVSNILDSIGTFANALSSADIDVQFAMATFGDAYDTKKAEDSSYTLGTGTDEPPSFDTVERPLVDFTDITSFQSFVSEVKSVVGSGQSGEDGAENYFGTVMAIANLREGQTGFTTRDGVPNYQVLIGDNCAHTKEAPGDTATGTEEETKWIPDAKADVSKLAGNTTVHVVRDTAFCGSDQLSLDDIAKATGGAILDLGSGSVDLADIKLDEFIKNFWFVTIPSDCIGGGTFNIILTLTVTFNTETKTQVFTFTKG